MRCAILPVALLALFAAGACAESTGSPVQKVIQMLSDMLTRSKEEKHSEQVGFTAYKQWCDDTTGHKSEAISSANDRIDALAADIQKAESDISEQTRVLSELHADIDKWSADKKSTLDERTEASAAYNDAHKDLSESVDALDRAITVLKKQSYDRKQAESALLQVRANKAVPEHAKKAITSFLESRKQEPDTSFLASPEANAYEFQSGGVVDMLERLKDEFEGEVDKAEKEELNSKHAASMVVQDLTDQIASSEEEATEKTAERAQREQELASSKGDHADTTASRNADKVYLRDLSAQCITKSSEYVSRQQLRVEEIEAISKAIEIMSSGDVSGAADKHLALAQSSFFQLRSVGKDSPVQKRVADFLAQRGVKLGSQVLSMLAVKVGTDAFKEVKLMIRDMITRLLDEANQEATHKGWCDTEMGTNKQTRERKGAQMAKLSAQVDELTASISQLGEEISDLSAALAELDASVSTATKEREEEHKKNTATVADSTQAQTAVAQALGVLKEFYAKAGLATSLVQESPADDAPGSWNEPFKGQQGAGGGVVGMLEVIQSDFARLETETKASEEASSREYKEFMNDSETDKAVKRTDLEHKQNKRQQGESDLSATKKDLAGTSDELDAANRYYDRLKPSCVNSGVSFEDRTSRRKEEIESLQEALRILSGEDIA